MIYERFTAYSYRHDKFAVQNLTFDIRCLGEIDLMCIPSLVCSTGLLNGGRVMNHTAQFAMPSGWPHITSTYCSAVFMQYQYGILSTK